MTATILDISSYGNSRSKDVYNRHTYQAVKGDGVSAATVKQSFNAIQSATTTSYELSRVEATESAVDSGIATMKVKVHDGTTLNDLLLLNNTTSQINTDRFTVAADSTYTSYFEKNGSAVDQVFTNAGTSVKLTAADNALTLTASDTTLTGDLHTNGIILKDSLAKGAKILLSDSATAPQQDFILGNLSATPTTVLTLTETLVTTTQDLDMTNNDILNVATVSSSAAQAQQAKITLNSSATSPSAVFTLGNLSGSPSTPLTINPASVDVVGTFNINGVDIGTTLATSNAFTISGNHVDLKASYEKLNLNTLNAYSANVVLDVNGSTLIRGNNLYMYDEAGTAQKKILEFDDDNSVVKLSAARAADSLKVQTFGTDFVDRLTFAPGDGVQAATFSNVNLGVGAAPSGTYKMEVTGTTYMSGKLSVAADIDALNNDILNVATISSTDTLAEQAKIALTSHATTPQIDMIVGNLSGSPTTALTLTEALATHNTDVTFSSTATNLNFPNAAIVNWKDSGATSRPVLQFNSSDELKLTNQALAGDVVVYSNNGSAGGELERMRVNGGAGTQDILLSNAHLGIGLSGASTATLDVNGTANISSSATIGGNLNMSSQDIVAVHDLINNTLAEGAKIKLTTHATAPMFDFYLGNLAGAPTDVLSMTESMSTFNTAVTIAGGDLTMSGADILNVHNVINNTAAKGSEMVLTSHATAPQIDFKIGSLSGVPAVPLTLTETSFLSTKQSTFNQAVTMDSSLYVGTTSTLVGDVSTTVLKQDLTGTSAGASSITLGTGSTGLTVRALSTTGTLSSTSPQFQVKPTSVEVTQQLNMNTNALNGVTNIIKDSAGLGGAKIGFTSGAVPELDIILGNLSGSPSTVATFKDTAIDFYEPVNFHTGTIAVSNDLTVAGNLTVQGTTVTLNVSQVSVEDINVDLANNATTNAQLDGSGLTVGASINDATPPSLLYASTAQSWNANKTFNVASGKSITVNDTDAILSASGLQFDSDAAALFLGSTQQWKMMYDTDGGSDVLRFMHWSGNAYVSKFVISAT